MSVGVSQRSAQESKGIRQADGRIRPNFLYVGAAKAGSTWIEYALRDHPQVYLPPVKDIFYFDRLYDRGFDWYLRHFQKAPPDAKAVGELSHDYFMHREALERIRADLPGVKLIVCLREPVSRLFSRYLYGLSVGDAAGLDVIAYAERADIKAEGDYLENLTNIRDLFDDDDVLVLFFEDLRSDAAAFVRRIYEFIGVDPDFVPSSVDTVVLGAQSARFTAVTYALIAVSNLLRRLGLVSLVGWAKRQNFVNAFLFKPIGDKPQLDPADRQELQARYSQTYDRLEQVLGRPLPASWRDDHGT